jgi:hypothetical protein
MFPYKGPLYIWFHLIKNGKMWQRALQRARPPSSYIHIHIYMYVYIKPGAVCIAMVDEVLQKRPSSNHYSES